ncbi:MAG: hypothetical protein QS98_C0002G0049 [archaeon GW2011_AR3]|nr:MAG: hypothetical protein QS98_C0002G0049 [archaeon GW2011_AR3]MBS3109960.1 hypothetical protein [Candidatus Woesearchaeota archaeon]
MSGTEDADNLLFQAFKQRRGEILGKEKKKRVKAEKKHASYDKSCEPGQAFHAIDGSSYASLSDFANALEHMSDDTFYYHVTDSKNDFHNWIKDVFQEPKLAEKLLHARTKEKHEVVMLRYLHKSA